MVGKFSNSPVRYKALQGGLCGGGGGGEEGPTFPGGLTPGVFMGGARHGAPPPGSVQRRPPPILKGGWAFFFGGEKPRVGGDPPWGPTAGDIGQLARWWALGGEGAHLAGGSGAGACDGGCSTVTLPRGSVKGRPPPMVKGGGGHESGQFPNSPVRWGWAILKRLRSQNVTKSSEKVAHFVW